MPDQDKLHRVGAARCGVAVHFAATPRVGQVEEACG